MSKELMQKAESGDIEAQCQVALLYEMGLDRPLDYKVAYKWWRKAADQGSDWALKNITDLIAAGHIEGKDAEPRTITKATKKILVVDDEVSLREVIIFVLEQQGFTVMGAQSGKEALEVLRDHPDVKFMFVDLQMPKMNGFQFIQTLRTLHASEGVPIVVITAYTKPEYVARGRKLGVQGWIMKPFKHDKIVDIVAELIDTKIPA